MFKRSGFVVMLILCTLSAPTMAHAKETSTFEEYSRLFTTIGVLTTTSTVVYFLESLSDRLLDKMFANVGQYLKHNHVAVQHDIALGAGPTLKDLATLFQLEAQEQHVMLSQVKVNRRALVSLLNTNEFDQRTIRKFSTLMLGRLMP